MASSQTFDIIIQERGIDPLVKKIQAIATSAGTAQQAVKALETTLNALPKSIPDPFVRFIAGAKKSAEQVEKLNTSMSATLSQDLSALIRQMSNLTLLYEKAAKASKEIRRPPAPPSPPSPPPLPPAPPEPSPNGGAGGISFGKAAAFVGTLYSAQKIVEMTDAYTGLENRFNAVAQTGGQANQMMERAMAIAQATHTPVEAVGTAYARYQRSLSALGYTSQEVGDVTETVAKALKLNGTTASEAGSVMLQLSQAFQKGKLDGDEFTSLAENFPGLGAAIAKAMNIEPVGNFMGEIYKLKSEGKLTMDIVVKAIQGMKETVDRDMKASSVTFSDSLVNMENGATSFFGKLNDNVGIVSGLGAAIQAVGNNFSIAGPIVIGALTTIGVIALPTMSVALGVAATAFRAFTAAMMSNPIGIIIGLLTGLAVYILSLDNPIQKLSNAWHIAFNFIENVTASVVNSILSYWNAMIEKIAKGVAYISKSTADSIRGMQTAYQAAHVDPNAGVDTSKALSEAEIQKNREASKEISKQSVELFKQGNYRASALLTAKSLFNIEGALADVNKMKTEQANINQRNESVTADLKKISAAAEESNARKRASNLTKEATQNKDVNVQIRAKNDLLAEQKKIILGDLAGKDGFKDAKTGDDVAKSLTPAQLKAVEAAAQQKTNDILDTAKQGLSVNAGIKGQKPQKEKKTPRTEDDIYGDSLKKYQDSIVAMEAYGTEEEKLTKIHEIELSMRKKQMALTEPQRQALEKLIDTERRRKEVHQEVTKLYDQGQGLERQFAIRTDAITEAFKRGFITEQQKSKLLKQLAEDQAKYNLEVGKGIDLENLRKLQNAAFDNAGSKEVFNKARTGAYDKAAGDTVGAQTQFSGQVAGIGDMLKDKKINQGQAFGQIQGTDVAQQFLGGSSEETQYKLQQYKTYNDQINQLRDQNIIGEETASQARALIWQGEQEEKYKKTKDMFDAVGQLAQSSNPVLSTIGNGAILAKAIMNVWLGISSAWAMPFPMNIIAGGTALAQGLSVITQMKSAASGGGKGYRVGGYTGDALPNDIAGMVHGQEYVINAQATRRNRPLLDDINRGRSPSTGTPHITINNHGTPQDYQIESVSRDEVRLIARDMAEKTVASRTPSLVASQIKNPNSHISKALGNSTKIERRRNG